MKKKVLSLLLSAALCMGTVSSTAFAEENLLAEDEIAVLDDMAENAADPIAAAENDQEQIVDMETAVQESETEVFVPELEAETDISLPESEAGAEISAPEAETGAEISAQDSEAGTELYAEPDGLEIVLEGEVTSEETRTLASAAQEGTCGLNGADVKWKLEDGVMTISGNGAMNDYITLADWFTGEILESNVQPWKTFDSQIKEVVIEEGVTVIGYSAFAGCKNLKKVTIADSVKTIRHNAFANCTALSEIDMGSGVEIMETSVFYGCAAESLTLPASLTSVDAYSLSGLWSAKNIYVEEGNTAYQSVDGVLFTNDRKTLVYYPMDRAGEYTIPVGTEKIQDSAFSQAAITGISIPDTVTEIGDMAFWQCENLTSLVFPPNIKKISRWICYEDMALTSVTIPEGVTEIADGAFDRCRSLTNVTLPSTVTTVASDAFPSTANVESENPIIHKLENGTFASGVAVNVQAAECYTQAFEVLNLVNKERAAAGLEPLTMDVSLLDTAMQRAFETILYWSHTRPSGTDCFTANSLMFGENIAMGQSTAKAVMTSWMNSSGHKANILSSQFTSIGIGCAKINNTYYWVQCFGCEVSGEAAAASYTNRDNNRTVIVKMDEEYYSGRLSVAKTALTVGQTQEAKVDWNGENLVNSGAVIESSDPSVCTVADGIITAVAPGTATIRMYFKGYEAAASEVKITVTKGTQVKVTLNANGGKISQKTATVIYKDTYGKLASPTRKGYVFSGWYTKKTGGKKVKATTVVSGKTKHTLYAHWKKVKTGKAVIKNAVNQSGKKLKVTWKKVSGADGYQVWYATNSKFTKGKKTAVVTGRSAVFDNLKKKTYYVKVRAYKLDSAGKKVYGKFSSVKKVKVTK